MRKKRVKESIAKNILFYRKKNKLTQKQLAEKIGVQNRKGQINNANFSLTLYPKIPEN